MIPAHYTHDLIKHVFCCIFKHVFFYTVNHSDSFNGTTSALHNSHFMCTPSHPHEGGINYLLVTKVHNIFSPFTMGIRDTSTLGRKWGLSKAQESVAGTSKVASSLSLTQDDQMFASTATACWPSPVVGKHRHTPLERPDTALQ